ncbi:hypothetical protein BH09VER1_BH09VER1_10240 [soil metagenome]
MHIDLLLIQQLEELCDGENVHLHANLVGAYRSAVSGLSDTGDDEYRVLAQDAERALRSLLYRMRLKNVGRFVRWQ